MPSSTECLDLLDNISVALARARNRRQEWSTTLTSSHLDIPAKWQVYLQSNVVNARSAENISKVTRGTSLIEMCSRRRTSQVIPPVARGILMVSLGPREKQREAFKLQANTPDNLSPLARPTFSRPAARTSLSVRFYARF